MVIDIDKFQFIGVFDCTHFEVSVRTFQGLYANRIKIGIYAHVLKNGFIKSFLFLLVAVWSHFFCGGMTDC